VVREAACRLALHIMLGADEAREGTKELGNREDGVPDMVVERALVKFAGKKVVATGVALLLAVAARGWGGLIEYREAQFAP
jgi:hypothetical protein